jgi:RNA polymerase sigma-70 factor (ECF subfamily)
MWSLSDELLLAGLASGEPEPAAAFVRRFQARVYGLALTIVGDPQAAEDIAQETLIRAWRGAVASAVSSLSQPAGGPRRRHSS